MTWTEDQQTQYSTTLDGLVSEYSAAYRIWTNTIQDSARDPTLQVNTDRAAAQVSSILQRMRLFVKDLQTMSSNALSKDTTFQSLNDLAVRIAEEKTELAKLRSESGTRTEQTHILTNPKDSPYTNILGLHRVLRDSTRFTLLLLSIVFGALALGIAIYMIYSAVSPGFFSSVLSASSRYGFGGVYK
jgi:hypothetical protein